jgi:hypothetical protein
MTVFNLLLAAKSDEGRGQHRKLMTDDEAQISVNGNRGHCSTAFNCFSPCITEGLLVNVRSLSQRHGAAERQRIVSVLASVARHNSKVAWEEE